MNSDSIIITGNTQLMPPSPQQVLSPQSIVSLPITITRKKEDAPQVHELINIKLEPFEELLSSNTQLRSSADITVQEITDWAKTFKIPQAAVNELLQILKIKRVKPEFGDSRTNAEPNVLQQSELFYFIRKINQFLIPFYPQKRLDCFQKSTNASTPSNATSQIEYQYWSVKWI